MDSASNNFKKINSLKPLIVEPRQPQDKEQIEQVLHSLEKVCGTFESALSQSYVRMDHLENSLRNTIDKDMPRLLDMNNNMNKTLSELVDFKEAQMKSVNLPLFPNATKETNKKLQPTLNLIRKPTIRQSLKSWVTQNQQKLKSQAETVIQEGTWEESHSGTLERALSQKACSEEITRLARKRIGGCLYNSTDHYYQKYSESKLSYQDMRIQFSWSIISDSFDLFKALKKRDNDVTLIQFTKEKKFELARLVDSEIRNVLEFMMKKYPPTRNKIVDTELSAKVKQVKKNHEFAYDMLKNAEFSFHYSAKKVDYTRDIKLWLNILISECKSQFGRFRTVIKSIFTGKGADKEQDAETNFESEYSISSKIHESTSLYTNQQIESRGLKLKRPQLLRILLKWIDELLQNVQNREEKIVSNKIGFKSINPDITINLTKKRKQALAEVLKSLHQTQILPLMEKQTEILDCLIMDLFNLTAKGFQGYESFDFKEVVICKISQYLSESVQAEVLKLLNVLIHSLNSVRDRFDVEVLQSNIDLMTFQIMDLLRCRYIGSRHQIMRIFNSLKDHSDYFEIVRVKNKLNQSTKDLLINLKIKDSFLICEMQLGLGESQEQVSNHFAHYIYELHRSRFPVLLECANQIVNLDPRIAYFNKDHPVKFVGDGIEYIDSIQVQDDVLVCTKNHKEATMVFNENDNPFCCNQCNCFIQAFTYSLDYLRCYECLHVICPACLVKNCPTFQDAYMAKYFKSSFLLQFFEPEPYFRQFGSSENLEKNALEAVKKHKYVLTCEFDCESMKMSIKKAHNGKLVNAFETVPQVTKSRIWRSNSNWNSIFIPKNVQTVKIDKLLYYQKLHIRHSWHEFDEWISEMNISHLIVILIDNPKKAMILDFEEDDSRLDDYVMKQQIFKTIEKQIDKSEIYIDLTGRQLTSLQALSIIKNKEAVKIVNVWENKLTDATTLVQFTNIQELYMRDNKVTNMQPLVKLQSLLLLNLQRNELGGSLPMLNLPNLKTLDISNNQLKDVNTLSESKMPHLAQLFIGNNVLDDVPTINNCPQLETIHMQFNRMSSLEKFAKSQCPNLSKIHSCGNQVKAFPILNFGMLAILWLHMNKMEDISNLEKSVLPKLELLKLNENRIKGALPPIDFPKLQKLELQQNSIEDCSVISTWKVPIIREINLKQNNLRGDLPRLPFPTLKKLYLQSNKIEKISTLEATNFEKLETKTHLQQLEELQLGHNLIEGDIPVLRFKKLRILNLSHNKLSGMESLSKSKLPYLQALFLQNNLFRCVVPVLFMDRLTELHLDNNDIQGFKFLIEIQLVPRLRLISVENNLTELSKIDSDKLSSMQDVDLTFHEASEVDRNMTVESFTHFFEH